MDRAPRAPERLETNPLSLYRVSIVMPQPSPDRIALSPWELSFRECARQLHEAALPVEQVQALRFLAGIPEKPEAGWECVWSFMRRGEGIVAGVLFEDPIAARVAVEILSRGSSSQMAELEEALSVARLPLSPQTEVIAEAVCSHEARRVKWFKEMMGTDPLVKLRALEILAMAPSGTLRNTEGMMLARYLFNECAEDRGKLTAIDKPETLAPYTYAADLIPRFFSRHANGGSLAVAELVMQRSQALSYLAVRVLVEHGTDEHRKIAFNFTLERDYLAPLEFNKWPKGALEVIQEDLGRTLATGTSSSTIILGCIRALQILRDSSNYEEAMFKIVSVQRWNGELARVVGEYVTAGPISPRAIEYARSLLEPPSPSALGTCGFKSPKRLFLAARPVIGEVQLATAILEAAHDPFRRDLYRRALAAWDVSGRWLVGGSRVVVACYLSPSSPEAKREILKGSSSDIEQLGRFHLSELLRFASETENKVSFHILNSTMRSQHTNVAAVDQALRTIESLWQKATGDEVRQAELVTYVASLPNRLRSAIIRVDLCCRVYESLQRIPRGAERAIQARFDEVAAEIQGTSMVVPNTEYRALKELIARDKRSRGM